MFLSDASGRFCQIIICLGRSERFLISVLPVLLSMTEKGNILKKDDCSSVFFSDNERYADLINGIGFGGRAVISAGDLHESDTKVYLPGTELGAESGIYRGGRHMHVSGKRRDLLRRTAFGARYAIIGIENQETVDYSIALRNLIYDAGDYEKQAYGIRKNVRNKSSDCSENGEFLYGFLNDSKLMPVSTLILYYGLKPWTGPRCLHDMIDFSDMPDEIKRLVPDYKINIFEIRALDTSVFRTDIREVFDFVRCSDSKEKIRNLVYDNPAYQRLESDAFDFIMNYSNSGDMIDTKKYQDMEGRVNMCKAFEDMKTEGKLEGKIEGKIEGKAYSVILLLENHGTVTDELKGMIMNETNDDKLKKYLITAAGVKSVSEFCEKVGL